MSQTTSMTHNNQSTSNVRSIVGSDSSTSKIREGVSELTTQAAEAIRAGQQHGMEKLEEGLEVAQNYSKQSLKSIREKVGQKPVRSLLIAAGAGVLLGSLFFRKN